MDFQNIWLFNLCYGLLRNALILHINNLGIGGRCSGKNKQLNRLTRIFDSKEPF